MLKSITVFATDVQFHLHNNSTVVMRRYMYPHPTAMKEKEPKLGGPLSFHEC